MIAERLATGVGLGILLNLSRGYVDCGMIRAMASVSVSIPFDKTVGAAKRWTLARGGTRGR